MQAGPKTTASARALLTHMTPALAEGDMSRALELLQGQWTTPELIQLLSEKQADVRKVAALGLGLIGDVSAIQPLAIALHDSDPMVNEVSEHALWSIWFRLGKPHAIRLLQLGTHHLNHGNYCCAAEHFSQAIDEDPGFAEAYNQRAIAHYLSERYDESIVDSRQALSIMPQHFGAMAGMGHCYSNQRQWAQARHCYRLALAIHPRLEGIQNTLKQVEKILSTDDQR